MGVTPRVIDPKLAIVFGGHDEIADAYRLDDRPVDEQSNRARMQRDAEHLDRH